MNTAILLCAALLTADIPAQVQAKVLYGTGPRDEQRADIDLWISKAAAKSGSPLAIPHTGWITLSADEDKWYEDFGWTAATVRRLDGLRPVIPETGRKDMDFVLERLSSLRTQNQQTSFKGWELYIWQKDCKSYFSLMVGTNRLKLSDEITKSAVEGLVAIKAKLDQLDEGEIVIIHGRSLQEKAPDEPAKKVAKYCEKIGLKAQ